MALILVGSEQELLKTYSEMDHSKIEIFFQDHGGDWITWKRNPPAASHMGGIWERQIRSAREILNSLLQTHGHSLNEESLQTLTTETEAIINSRPLTVETVNDGQSPMPISPNDILTMKTKMVMPPPGVFQKPDLYCGGGKRNLSRPCRNVRSGSKCQEISALVTLCC